MAQTRQTDNPPCIIYPGLWKQWLGAKRNGDVERIMALAKRKKLPSSKPVITQSLLYGYCNNDDLRDLISKYFADRHTEEIAQSERLIELHKQSKRK